MPDTDVPTQDPQEPVELQLETAHDDDDASSGSGLTAAQASTLVRVLRVAYPHPSFPDGPYERTAQAVQNADSDNVLAAGLDDLGSDFGSLSDEDATAAITAVEKSPFFKLIHSTTVVALYDDHEVWEILGYEGASYDKGGYIDRGFDDLDWLPDPRIEEYTGEPRVELVVASTGTSHNDQGAQS